MKLLPWRHAFKHGIQNLFAIEYIAARDALKYIFIWVLATFARLKLTQTIIQLNQLKGICLIAYI